jgi:hypothetical protein
VHGLNFFHSLVIHTTIPIFIVAFFFFLGHRATKKGDEGRSYLLTQTAFFLIFLAYPSMSRKVFQYFITRPFDGDYGTFLAADLGINVADDAYQIMRPFSIMILFVWPFGVPMGVACLLWRNRAALLELRRIDVERSLPPEARRPSILAAVETRMMRHTSRKSRGSSSSDGKPQVEGILWSITESYKPNAFYWDLFEYTIQKLALIGLTVFYPDPGSYEQLVLGILICFGYVMLLTFYRPYVSKADNILAILSQCALFVAMLQSVILKGKAAADVPFAVVTILVVSALLPTVIMVAMSVQVVFNECGVDPVVGGISRASGSLRRLQRSFSERSSRMSVSSQRQSDGDGSSPEPRESMSRESTTRRSRLSETIRMGGVRFRARMRGPLVGQSATSSRSGSALSSLGTRLPTPQGLPPPGHRMSAMRPGTVQFDVRDEDVKWGGGTAAVSV